MNDRPGQLSETCVALDPLRRPGASSHQPEPLAAPLLFAVVVSLVIVNIPRSVSGIDLDSSWSAVLAFAHKHGWQFGKDAVFTYGPLGYLFPFRYSGEPLISRLIFSSLFSFALAGGLCVLTWRLSVVWRLFFFAFLLLSPISRFLRPDQLINAGFLCWGTLCLVETGPRASVWGVVLSAAVITLAFAKFVWLVVGGLTLAVVAMDWYLRGRVRGALWLAVGTPLGIFLLWLVLGQESRNLPAFLWYAAKLSHAYADTMGIWCDREVRIAGVALLLLTLITMAIRALTAFPGQFRHQGWRRWVVCVWLVTLTFAAWKHGFLRGDQHVTIFLVFAPLALLMLLAAPAGAPWVEKFSRGAAVLAVVLACAALNWTFPNTSTDWQVGNGIRSGCQNLRTLIRPGPYVRQMESDLRDQAAQFQLLQFRAQTGDATVDVFGYSQALAILNGFNYHPRPVFQSYAASTKELMELNERFYLSPQAPDYVIFNLASVDDRFPPLEDALALRALLRNYRLEDAFGWLLLLKKTGTAAPRLKLLSEGTTRAGEPIRLTNSGNADLWVQIQVRPNLFGRIMQFFYQLPVVEVAAWDGAPAARTQRRRAPPAMMEAGFLASPWLLSNDDVANYYKRKDLRCPKALSVEIGERSRAYFQQAIRFRVYQVGPDKTLLSVALWLCWSSLPWSVASQSNLLTSTPGGAVGGPWAR